MSNIRPYPLDNNENSYLSKIGTAINSHNIVAGNGIKIKKGSEGIHITSHNHVKPDGVLFKNYYDFNAEYYPNDMVVIDPNKIYYDQTGGVLNLTPGATYVCQIFVPASNNDTAQFNAVVTAYGTVVPNEMTNGYRWYSYNKYYPPNPSDPIPTPGTATYGAYTISTNQTFWKPVGGSGGTINYYNFDESASYSKNDIVWIDPNKVPHYTIPFVSTSGSNPPLSAGTFICSVSVPALTFTSSSISSSITSSRSTSSFYYPFYPGIPSASMVTVSGSTYNQNYWSPISPYIAANMCVNGVDTPVFIDGVVSGSTYIYRLPYP